MARDGQTGGFLIPPLLTAFQMTGARERPLKPPGGLLISISRILTIMVLRRQALSIPIVLTRSSAIPLFKASLLLYIITGELKYLEKAEHSAYYLSTWQWHHTVKYAEDTASNKLDHDTFGGTSVSTQHHHQDPYGLVYVTNLLKLADLTGNPIWKERAQALWAQRDDWRI